MQASQSVKLRLIRGRNLLAADDNGKSDPYAKLWLEGPAGATSKKKSHTIKKTLNPEWDEKFVFPVASPQEDKIYCELWDKDTFSSDDSLGGCVITLMGLVTGVEALFTIPISGGGDIEVGLTAISFDSSQMSPAERNAVIAGNPSDPSTTFHFAPPQRFEVNDPKKFYSRPKFNHPAGYIQLFLNKPYYLGGETVVGHVELGVSQTIHGVKGVMVKWKGFEKTYIEDLVTYKSGDQIRTRVDKYHEDKTFFNDKFVLAQVPGGTLTPGTYTYPFQYKLPPGLPSVFYYKGNVWGAGDKCKVGVFYKLKAFVDMPSKDIKAKEKLIIAEDTTQRIMPVSDKKVKSFVFAKGKMAFEADIGKDVFVPGETLPVHVKITNPSSKKVKKIQIKLKLHLKVKAKGMVKYATKEMLSVKFPGVEKGKNLDCVCPLLIPNDIYPSVSGKLINGHYELTVGADIPMAFDLEIKPKVRIALLPAPDQYAALQAQMFGGYTSGGWQ